MIFTGMSLCSVLTENFLKINEKCHNSNISAGPEACAIKYLALRLLLITGVKPDFKYSYFSFTQHVHHLLATYRMPHTASNTCVVDTGQFFC
jgi:hypothetical protein